MTTKNIKHWLVVCCITLASLVLAGCNKGDPEQIGSNLTPPQVQKFEKVYAKYGPAWIDIYTLYNMFGLDANRLNGPVSENSVYMFYMMLNVPDIGAKVFNKDEEFVAPALDNYRFAYQVCNLVLDDTEQMDKLARIPDIKQFCQNTNYYYRLFISNFSEDLVKSITASIYANKIPPRLWEKIQSNQAGFTYVNLTAADLEKTSPKDRY